MIAIKGGGTWGEGLGGFSPPLPLPPQPPILDLELTFRNNFLSQKLYYDILGSQVEASLLLVVEKTETESSCC